MTLKCIFWIGFVVPVFTFGQTTIFNETFEGGIPATWTIVDNDHATLDASIASEYPTPWAAVIDPEDTSNTVASCGTYFDPEGTTASRWLITPPINLGAFGNFLHWKAKSQDPSYPDSYVVLLSSTGTDVADFTDTVYVRDYETEVWTSYTTQIDTSFDSTSVYLAFVDRSYYGYKLYLDSVSIEKWSTASLPKNSTPANIEASIYPNPASDIVHIQSAVAVQRVEVYNLQGELVQLVSENMFSIRDLQCGLYILKIQTEQGVATKRLVKE